MMENEITRAKEIKRAIWRGILEAVAKVNGQTYEQVVARINDGHAIEVKLTVDKGMLDADNVD